MNSIIKSVIHSEVVEPLTSAIYKIWMSFKYGVIVYYYEKDKVGAMKLVKEVKNEVKMLLSDNESYTIYRTVKNIAKIDGDIAEIGCYKGSSSKLICEAKAGKNFYIFDTFSGLPKLSNNDNYRLINKGDYSATLSEVKKYLSDYSNVFLYKGKFPSTSSPIRNNKFSFVHLDADLYKPTLSGLIFFYPRMTPGGVFLIHDYTTLSGVKKAVEKFFLDKKEAIIEIPGTQCLIVKIGD